ncbi:MAG: hypothetical protein RLY93_16255 [Sumerlaeia bacterium]
MKTILIASATGGSAKTTTAVRLAESLKRARVPAGVMDLSPYPTANYLVREKDVFALNGRGAATSVAVDAMLRPLEDRCRALVIDTGRLDDPMLDFWIEFCDAMILTTRVDAFALKAFEGIWDSLEQRRKDNPEMKFLGFLPVVVGPEEKKNVRQLQLAASRFVLETAVPFDQQEILRAQSTCIEGLDPLPADYGEASREAYDALAAHTIGQLGIEQLPQTEPERKKEVGLFTKLWRVASKSVRPKVSTQGGY